MKRVAIILLSLAVLGAAVVNVLRDPAAEPLSSGVPARASEDAHSGGQQKVEATAGKPAKSVTSSDEAQRLDGQTPAWLLPPPRTPANPAVPVSGNADNPKIHRLNAVLEKLNRLQSQPDIDAREAVAAIAELEQINGSAVMNGIRLDVLRENVQVADQVETAAKALQALQQSSSGNLPERAALIQSKTAELDALRARIRHDFLQSPADVPKP